MLGRYCDSAEVAAATVEGGLKQDTDIVMMLMYGEQ